MSHVPSDNDFKDTLNLPRTDFPLRTQPQDDHAMIIRWHHENLSSKAMIHNKGNKKFIFHDGPPYANGHIHLGSAYNKILKDIVCKAYRMTGLHVPVKPGWDCHGLPIELNVSKENPSIHGAALKKACREYAQKWIQIQKEEFRSLGVLMDWENPYLTMSFNYEAAIMKAFGICLQKGFVSKKNKTVPWCISCKTVLATAEIEYKERKDPSLYVLFRVIPSENIQKITGDTPLYVAIWTTTPWTLPLNRAVMIGKDIEYALLQEEGRYILVGSSLVKSLSEKRGVTPVIKTVVKGADLISSSAQHPLEDNCTVPFVLHDAIAITEGTAAVHCAPGCGPEDYEVGLKNNLEIYSPITSDGLYDETIKIAALRKTPITDGLSWVIKQLSERGLLLHKESIKHNYPHCWRCRNGLIFRATSQWFIDLTHDNLREKALEAIKNITFVPERSIGFLRATVQSRLEWCISRQRTWGVPIPALICDDCNNVYTNKAFIDSVAQGVEKEGVEYWDNASVADLAKGLCCAQCGKCNWQKEQAILDVWFDSGVSHFAVLENKANDLAFPADMYLEGVDQHRGWFQSSLLTALAIEEQAPMKSIVTHGFTVDDKGHKMSKSLGNVITPAEIIAKVGVDGLRLWASSISHGNDAVVSDALLKNIAEVYRKIRNTARFLLSNLYDFDHEQDIVSYDNLLLIDKYGLQKLNAIHTIIQEAYEKTDFASVFHTLSEYCAQELSAFYLDVIKDRLYVEKPKSIERRSAQTVCYYILDTITKDMAPILSCTAEQIADYYQKNKSTSIHLQNCVALNKEHKKAIDDVLWEQIVAIRSSILRAIEQQRALGIIKHSLESSIHLYLAPTLYAQLEQMAKDHRTTVEHFMKELCIVSIFKIYRDQISSMQMDAKGEIGILVQKADGSKCLRCWHWVSTITAQGICERCTAVLNL